MPNEMFARFHQKQPDFSIGIARLRTHRAIIAYLRVLFPNGSMHVSNLTEEGICKIFAYCRRGSRAKIYGTVIGGALHLGISIFDRLSGFWEKFGVICHLMNLQIYEKSQSESIMTSQPFEYNTYHYILHLCCNRGIALFD